MVEVSCPLSVLGMKKGPGRRERREGDQTRRRKWAERENRKEMSRDRGYHSGAAEEVKGTFV